MDMQFFWRLTHGHILNPFTYLKWRPKLKQPQSMNKKRDLETHGWTSQEAFHFAHLAYQCRRNQQYQKGWSHSPQLGWKSFEGHCPLIPDTPREADSPMPMSQIPLEIQSVAPFLPSAMATRLGVWRVWRVKMRWESHLRGWKSWNMQWVTALRWPFAPTLSESVWKIKDVGKVCGCEWLDWVFENGQIP